MVTPMLTIALIVSNQFLPSPNQGTNHSLLTCVTSCQRDPMCASFFYNFDTGLCYFSFYLYSLVKYGEQLIPTTDNVKYFEWTTGSCNATNGWTYHKPSRFCFKFHDTDRQHPEAEADCLAQNATLVRADDSRRLQFIHQFAETYSKHIWTSGELIDSIWYWGPDAPFGNNSSWKVDHPQSGKECVMIRKDEAEWYSDKCDTKERFMCQLNDVITDYCSVNVKAVSY